MKFRLLAALIVLCVMMVDNARADPQIVKQAVAQQNLARDPLWLNLLQYDMGRNTPRSDILPGEFFLSDDGRTNPAAELAAFIDAAYPPLPADPNDHAICRFPARALFLERKLGIDDLPVLRCPAFEEWSGRGRITDATLILASGSVGDPATFYGHILLKFTTNTTFSGDTPRHTGQGSLLDTSLNYGAIFPENENGVIYVIKGLFGGYSSTYTSVEYYEQRGNYVQTQDRDLWEYRLNLSRDEVALLVASSWELYQQENTYYFLSENCAYRFAELIAMVTGQDIEFQGKPWSLPLDVFVDLAAMNGSDGRPLVESVERVHAPTNRFLSAFAELDPDQQDALHLSVRAALDRSATYAPVPYFPRSDISDQDRAEVVEAALLYIAMIRARDEDGDAQADINALNQAFLLQRVQLPAGDTRIGLNSEVRPPHEGHLSTAHLTYLNNSQLGAGFELRLRPVLTDFLSLPVGAAPFSELAMGDISLIIRGERVRLQRFDALRITAISTQRTRLPYEYRPSWRVRFGAESAHLARDGDTVAFAEFGYGHASAPTPDSALYAMIEGRLDTGPDMALAGVSIGAIARISDSLQIAMSGRGLVPFEDRDAPILQSDIAVRIGARQDRDFRLIARYEDEPGAGKTAEFGLTCSWHF